MMDAFEEKILIALQRDGKINLQDLAAEVGLSTSPCWRRVKRLEEQGFITKYTAILDPVKLGLQAFAYVHVSLTDHSETSVDTFNRFVETSSQVVECASITGDNDYVLKVAAKDPEGLERFIMKRILRLGIVRNATTNFVLRQTKSGAALPVTQFS